jgi:TonB family protein
MPEFPGGIKGLNRFLSRNLKYPADARNAGVQGTVRVSFLVTPAGQIENPEIVEGLSHGCNEEVIRLVNLMPPWTPGRQDGKPVTVRYSMPFQFRMH